jgi:hypothetical protein
MTVPYDFEQADTTQNQAPGEWGNMEPIPVKITRTQDQRMAAETSAHTTWSIPQAGTALAIMICPHLYKRYKAQLQVCIPEAGGATAIVLNSKPDMLNNSNPQGSFWYPPSVNTEGNTIFDLPPYEAMQRLYAIAVGGVATISVMDQSFKTVQ